MLNNNNDIQELDYLSLFGTFLGVMNYIQNLRQTSNDDLMEELKNEINDNIASVLEQNEKIIKQNEIILKQNELLLRGEGK